MQQAAFSRLSRSEGVASRHNMEGGGTAYGGETEFAGGEGCLQYRLHRNQLRALL